MKGSIHIDNLCFGRDSELCQAFSLQLDAPEIVILSGRNGVGKSTLLKTLTGLIHSRSGSVTINTVSVSPANNKALAQVVSYVNTDRVREEYIKVEEMILFGRYPYLNNQLANSAITALEEAIQLLNIDSIRHKYLNSISDGEWQKANIARALVQDTPVIIMDEPSAFLDYPAKVQLFKDLQTIAQNKNKLIIVSTHDLDIANRYGSAFWQIENGVLSTSRQPFAMEL